MPLRPRLPLVATAAAAVALLLVLGSGVLAQQEPEQDVAGDRLSSRPPVGYRYRVETVNAREATVVSLEVSTRWWVSAGFWWAYLRRTPGLGVGRRT